MEARKRGDSRVQVVKRPMHIMPAGMSWIAKGMRQTAGPDLMWRVTPTRGREGGLVGVYGGVCRIEKEGRIKWSVRDTIEHAEGGDVRDKNDNESQETRETMRTTVQSTHTALTRSRS